MILITKVLSIAINRMSNLKLEIYIYKYIEVKTFVYFSSSCQKFWTFLQQKHSIAILMVTWPLNGKNGRKGFDTMLPQQG